MSYSQKEVITKFNKEFNDKQHFYNAEFINRIGKSNDTPSEFYTEIIARELGKRLGEFILGIRCICRKHATYYPWRDEKKIDSKSERGIENRLYQQERFDCLGHIICYQIPLQEENSDLHSDAADLVSFDGKTLRVLELKKPRSKKGKNETMLRCVLEGFTYKQVLCREKLIADLQDAKKLMEDIENYIGRDIENDEADIKNQLKNEKHLLSRVKENYTDGKSKLPNLINNLKAVKNRISVYDIDRQKIVVKASPLVNIDSLQYDEIIEMKEGKRPELEKLMLLLDSEPFYYYEENKDEENKKYIIKPIFTIENGEIQWKIK